MDRSYYARKLSAERLERVYTLADRRVQRYLQAEIDHLAAGVRPGMRILEVGCGYGRVLAPLARRAGGGWGIDNAPESLALARRRYPWLHLAAMDAAALGFAPGAFDRVVGVQNFISACRVPPERVLAECLRVTRPGGRVLLASYAEAFWPHRLAWFRQQAAEGLLGPIDEAATGNGVIVCRDGFRAVTFGPREFEDLARACGVTARIYSVDAASLFCEIQRPVFPPGAGTP